MASGMETFPGDFALVKTTGTKFRVVQICRAVFNSLDQRDLRLFSSTPAPTALVYVEWFSPHSLPPDNIHGPNRGMP